MLEQVLVGLLLAGISGVSFIAYKHPSGYAKINPYLHYGSLVALVIGATWNVAIDSSWIAIAKFFAPENREAAYQASLGLKLPYPWLFIGCLGATAYFLFLANLPRIVGGGQRE
jgi:hypothetical protein